VLDVLCNPRNERAEYKEDIVRSPASEAIASVNIFMITVCHNLLQLPHRCHGNVTVGPAMSDLCMIRGMVLPCTHQKAQRDAPRDFIPSMQVPAMSSCSIIELGANSPADWSLISLKVSVLGL